MTGSGEYERGIQDQRLQGHDEHLGVINGSLERIADELSGLKAESSGMRMDLQRLADAVESNQRTVATTASAVEAERKATAEAVEQQRTSLRDTAERKWSPLARIGTIVAIVGALTGLITWLISIAHQLQKGEKCSVIRRTTG